MKPVLLISVLSLSFALVSACGKGSADGTAASEDTSASGAAASAAGGALSDSSSAGTFAIQSNRAKLQDRCEMALSFLVPSAQATNSCPTYATAAGATCSASSANMWLSDSSCTYGSGTATWTGTKLLQISSGTAVCGTFPKPTGAGTLTRQFVTNASSTTASTLVRVNAQGTSVTADDATTNLGNFDSQPISTLINSGYGTQVTFNSSGARTGVTIARRLYSSGRFDESISGTLTVNETASSSTSRVLSGSVNVYHNLLKVIGSSVFNSVTHSNGCCVPVSGSIQTTFARGTAAPTLLGSALIGKSETLTFTGCGTATLQSADGSSASVSLSNCF